MQKHIKVTKNKKTVEVNLEIPDNLEVFKETYGENVVVYYAQLGLQNEAKAEIQDRLCSGIAPEEILDFIMSGNFAPFSPGMTKRLKTWEKTTKKLDNAELGEAVKFIGRHAEERIQKYEQKEKV